MNQRSNLHACAEFIRKLNDQRPTVSIILGSGLGGLADRIEDPTVISYERLPGFQTSSAHGHRGALIIGRLEGGTVIAMAGRLHRYEGWSNEEVAFPVRVMAELGARVLIVSNAAGGVRPGLRAGDLVVIRDHIDWLGGRFDGLQKTPLDVVSRQGDLYDSILSEQAMRIAVQDGFTAYEGTYLATLGPAYETRSEYRMMRRIGADVVGMSTVPEVFMAARLKMRTLGLSMVSNVANPDRATKVDHSEVLEAGLAAEVKMESIVRGVIRSAATGHERMNCGSDVR